MKKIFFALLVVTLCLCSCSDTGADISINGSVTTDGKNITETTAETAESFTEITEIINELPSFFPEDFVFPKTDGSTSTTNLDNAIRNAILGGEQKVSHTKTYTSFENLLSGNCELIFTTPLSDAQFKRMAEVGFKHEAEPVAGE